jgi:transmembrane sensor
MAEIDRHILEQAADWLVQLHSGNVTQEERNNLRNWRQQNAQHELAWQRAESFLQTFEQLPPSIGKAALQRPISVGRRKAVSRLALLLAAGPAVWLASKSQPWMELTSDYHTATGEQQRVQLADGSELILNTATVINVHYSASQRLVILEQGELYIATSPDNASTHRPFIVQTSCGSSRALGTRFSLRCFDDFTRLAVFEGAVEVSPVGSTTKTVIATGQQADFTVMEARKLGPVASAQELWTRGMLVARNMRFADIVEELGRYRKGVLRYHPELASLRVSGAFPLTDSDRCLRLLQETMPVSITTLTRYWVKIEPRT